MTQALRSPGSTLKPFIYGLGFEDGLIHPETLIDDKPSRYGNYAPENFDLTFQGTVTIRRALQLSLNVPAIAVLGKVGVSRLSARITPNRRRARSAEERSARSRDGTGRCRCQAHGSGDALRALARQGSAMAVTELADATPPSPRRLLDPVAAWYVGNVLMGAPPPDNAPHGRIAFKTGTSYGYRDAWAIGFDGRIRSVCGSGGPTVRRCPDFTAARPQRRFCSMPLPVPDSLRCRYRRRRKARSSRRTASFRRRCSGSAPVRVCVKRSSVPYHVPAGRCAAGIVRRRPA